MICQDKDSLLNYNESMKYLEQAHALESKLLKQKNLDLEDCQSALALHFVMSEVADSLKDYVRMHEVDECGTRLYEKVVAPKIHASSADTLAEEFEEMEILHAMLYTNLGNALGKRGKYEESAASFEKGLSIIQELIESPAGSPVQYAMKWNFRLIYSLMYSKMKGDYEKAYDVIIQNLPEFQAQINTEDSDMKELMEMQAPMYIFYMADGAYETARYEQCAQLCADALTWPNHMYAPAILDKRGQALLKLGQEDEARECWSQVKEIIPDFYDNDLPNNPLRDKFGK